VADLPLDTRLDAPFESLAGFTEDSFNLTSGGDPERVQAELVSPSYFGILGQRPVVGSLFAANAERSDGGDRVVLIGEGIWHRRFGGDPSVIGRTVELDRKQLTVIGVLPAAFHGLTGKAEVWIPLTAPQYLWYPEALTEAGNHWFDAVGRVRPGTTPEQLAAAMRAAGAAIDAAHPRPAEMNDGSTWTAAATSLVAARRDPSLRRALLVLLGAVVASCSSPAPISATCSWCAPPRGGARSPCAPRSARAAGNWCASCSPRASCSPASAAPRGSGRALDADRPRRIRPGTLAGWGVSSNEGLDLASATIDARVVAFGIALALVVGISTGLVPALRAARFGLVGALKEGAGVLAGAGGHRRGWGRAALVAGELALALMLLACAGLLLRSFGKLSRLDLGFAPEHLLTAQFHAAEGEYTRETAQQFHDALLARVEAIPGVVSASLSTCGPLTQGCNGTLLTRIDGKPRDVRERVRIGVHFLSPKHLATLRAPLVEGREFTAADRAGAPRVALVSVALAHSLWPGESALGHHLAPGQGGFGKDEQAEVVGVVGDLRYGALADAPELDVYLAESQAYPNARMLFVRTAGDPLGLLPAVRAAMKSVSPTIPLYGVRTMRSGSATRCRVRASPPSCWRCSPDWRCSSRCSASMACSPSWSPRAAGRSACAWRSARSAAISRAWSCARAWRSRSSARSPASPALGL
jgi:hypothetical protein